MFLMGVKTHKKIHAIAGIAFMAMLVVSIITEIADEGRAGVWLAEIREGIPQNRDLETTGAAATAEAPEATMQPTEGVSSPTREPSRKETASSTREPSQNETASPARKPAPNETLRPTREPVLNETSSPIEQSAPNETPSPVKQSAPNETPSPANERQEKSPVPSIIPSPVKTASPSPEKKEEVKTYRPQDYGIVESEKQEFYGEDGEVSYYYKMENFYLSDTFSRRVNAVLQKIYDDYEAQYLRTAELIESGFDEFDESAGSTQATPYDYWQLVGLKYVGKDYISILYNDIPYMSNTHPYSRFDGITINCRTGKEVTASEFLEKSNEEILEEVSEKMGLEDTATWDDIDFYLTDSTIVFVYRVPDWWEDVVMPRT